jgi:glycogen synthase
VSFGGMPTGQQTAWIGPCVDFRFTDYRLEWMQDCARDLRDSARYLEQVIGEVKPDLLHLNQYCYGTVAPRELPRIVVAHSDVLSWWAEVHGTEAPHNPWLDHYRHVVRNGLAAADVVVAPSRWMLQALCRRYPAPHNARVIYNGRDPRLFTPGADKDNFVLSVGRLWDQAKQIRLLAELGHMVPAVIAGCEQQHGAGANQVPLRLGASMVGPKSETELASLYARAAIYAGTSRYDPFGLAPLEAALSGCALLLNHIASFREIWHDAAVYFRTNDRGSMATAIQRLLSNPELLREYGFKAYSRACRLYSAGRMVADYLSLYAALVPAEVAA